ARCGPRGDGGAHDRSSPEHRPTRPPGDRAGGPRGGGRAGGGRTGRGGAVGPRGPGSRPGRLRHAAPVVSDPRLTTSPARVQSTAQKGREPMKLLRLAVLGVGLALLAHPATGAQIPYTIQPIIALGERAGDVLLPSDYQIAIGGL